MQLFTANFIKYGAKLSVI